MPADLQSTFIYGCVEQYPDGSVDASDSFNELHGNFASVYHNTEEGNLAMISQR